MLASYNMSCSSYGHIAIPVACKSMETCIAIPVPVCRYQYSSTQCTGTGMPCHASGMVAMVARDHGRHPWTSSSGNGDGMGMEWWWNGGGMVMEW